MSSISRAVLVVLATVVLCWVISGPLSGEAAISCGGILSRMSSCMGYLRGGGSVPISCCDGLSNLNKAAATTPDIQAACQCIKSLVPNIGARPQYVNSLPGICHVNIPYKYTPSIDCSKVVRG